jgi:hypothetical protein
MLFMDRFFELDVVFMESSISGASENIVPFHFWIGAGVDTETFILALRLCVFFVDYSEVYLLQTESLQRPT